jgi:hypothetical protein
MPFYSFTASGGGGGGGGGNTAVSTITVSGPATLNAGNFGVFVATLTGNTTFTFAGAALAATAYSFTLYLNQDGTGGRTVTWPGSVSWIGGSQPTLPTTASAQAVLVFETYNQGTTWWGSLIAELPSEPFGVSIGGTGGSTWSTGQVFVGAAASPLTTVSDSTALAGQSLTSKGPGRGVQWSSPPTGPITVVAYASTITIDVSTGSEFITTLTGNATLANPLNPSDGQTMTITVCQDANGSHTLAYGSAFLFSSALPSPTLSTTGNEQDYLQFQFNGIFNQWIFTGFVKGFAGSLTGTGWAILDDQAVTTSLAHNGGAGYTYTLPLGAPAANQLDILCVNCQAVISSVASSSGASWVAGPALSGNQIAGLWYRVANGSEPATVVVTTASDIATVINWARFAPGTITGVTADVAVDAKVDNVSGSASPAVNTGTLASTGELVVACAALAEMTGTSPSAPVWSSGYSAAAGASSGTSGGDVASFIGYKGGAGTTAETPSVTWTGAALDRYSLVQTFIP